MASIHRHPVADINPGSGRRGERGLHCCVLLLAKLVGQRSVTWLGRACVAVEQVLELLLN